VRNATVQVVPLDKRNQKDEDGRMKDESE
jgi:hypothetical protein